jgi:hypothetical protein
MWQRADLCDDKLVVLPARGIHHRLLTRVLERDVALGAGGSRRGSALFRHDPLGSTRRSGFRPERGRHAGRIRQRSFRALDARTTRIEFEVPKSDFEILGWTPHYLPLAIPPDPDPQAPHKLRGWYIKGNGVADEEEDDQSGGGQDRKPRHALAHPLIVFSSSFPYTIAHTQQVGSVYVGRQMRKTITYLVGKGYDVLFFDKRGHGYSQRSAHSTFHSRMPAEKFGWSWASMRRPLHSTGVNVTRLYLFRSVV